MNPSKQAARQASDRGARPRLRLLARIHRRWPTVTDRVTVGTLSFDFTRIADPNQVLDEVAEEEDRQIQRAGRRLDDEQLHLPYWAELWDSAYGVGRFLVGNGQWAVGGEDRRQATAHHPPPAVLDLGCGMGLAGTVAAALGAQVCFADLETPALLFARLNSLPWRTRVRTRQLNWQTDRLLERFDLILGSDILYERQQWPYLEPFWRQHLKEEGRILLGEPGRQTGDAFPSWIVGQGWHLLPHDVPVATRPKPIRVFELWR